MRTCIVKEFGDAGRVEITAVDDPVAGPGEVVIGVRAAALNRIDLSLRRGDLAHAGLLAPAPAYTLGWDVAGEVVGVGVDVRRFAVGDRVIGLRDVLGWMGVELLSVPLPGWSIHLDMHMGVVDSGRVLARSHGIGVDAAFDLMRDYARRNQHRLSDVAHAVVTDPGRHPELTLAG